MSCATKLKMIRISKKQLQEDMAEELHTSKSAISRYETGEQQPDEIFINKVAEVYNINKEWLTSADNDNFIFESGSLPNNSGTIANYGTNYQFPKDLLDTILEQQKSFMDVLTFHQKTKELVLQKLGSQ